MGFSVKIQVVAPLQARRLRGARSQSGISVAAAARRMDLSLFAYLQLEQGAATMTDEEWKRAIDLIGTRP